MQFRIVVLLVLISFSGNAISQQNVTPSNVKKRGAKIQAPVVPPSAAPAPATAPPQEVPPFSPKYREAAYRACKTIERIKVLDLSEGQFDAGYLEAQRALDDVELNTESAAEKRTTFSISMELTERLEYHSDLIVVKEKHRSEYIQLATLFGSDSASAQMALITTQSAVDAKAKSFEEKRASADRRLHRLAESIKAGREIEEEKPKDVTATELSEGQAKP